MLVRQEAAWCSLGRRRLSVCQARCDLVFVRQEAS